MIACVVGGIGGLLAYRLGFPAPWLVGSTVAVALVALTPLEPGVPAPLRNLAFAIIGASMGSGVDAETLSQASKWSVSLAMMLAGIPVMMAASYQYFRRVVGYDSGTALLSASPGGLSATMAMAAQGYGDIQRIALIQCFRLLFLTAALPHLIAPLMPSTTSLPVRDPDMALPALASVLALALLFGWLADRARIPAAFIISGVLVKILSGLTEKSQISFRKIGCLYALYKQDIITIPKIIFLDWLKYRMMGILKNYNLLLFQKLLNN